MEVEEPEELLYPFYYYYIDTYNIEPDIIII